MFDRSLQGRRVQLVHCDDPYTNLKPGDEGTVQFFDDAGNLHINWQSGSTLGLIPGEDSWEILDDT